MVEDQKKVEVDDATRERVQRLVNKIKQASADVCITGMGILEFKKDELQDALDLLLFSTDAAVQAAKDADLTIPEEEGKEKKDNDTVTFKMESIDEPPVIQFATSTNTKKPINLVSVQMRHPNVSLGIHGAQAKPIQVDTAFLLLGNGRMLSDDSRKPGQVTIYAAKLNPDPYVNQIPGITGPEKLAIATTGKSKLGEAIEFLTEGSCFMTMLGNKANPIIAANGPEHATTTVQGITADIDNDTLTLRFYRDKFFQYSSRTGFPQRRQFSFAKP